MFFPHVSSFLPCHVDLSIPTSFLLTCILHVSSFLPCQCDSALGGSQYSHLLPSYLASVLYSCIILILAKSASTSTEVRGKRIPLNPLSVVIRKVLVAPGDSCHVVIIFNYRSSRARLVIIKKNYLFAFCFYFLFVCNFSPLIEVMLFAFA